VSGPDHEDRAGSDKRALSRVLVVSPRPPWPTRGGLELRAASVLVALSELGHEVGLATFASSRGESTLPADVRMWCPEVDADDDPGSADQREWFKAADGHPTDRWWTAQTDATVRRALAEFAPQLVVLDGPWTRHALPIVAEAPNRHTALCAHNVEGALGIELVHSSSPRIPAAIAALLARRSTAVEAMVVAAVDQIWACSADDAALFNQRYAGCAPVSVVPNVVAVPPPAGSSADLEHPLLLFIGTLTHPPNAEAAIWLVSELMPRLTAIGLDARLRIIGDGAPARLRELARGHAVEITGFVEDLEPHLREAAVVPVPLIAGGGTRFKALEAFANRIAVVSTPKGVEGLAVRDRTHYLAAETPAEFASAITDLCSNGPLRGVLTQRAYELVERAYSPAAMRRAVAAALAALHDGSSRSLPAARSL
jgi:glycosyltransferase involved in cell wall biosynthesis